LKTFRSVGQHIQYSLNYLHLKQSPIYNSNYIHAKVVKCLPGLDFRAALNPSSVNQVPRKTYRHDMTEIILKVALNTIARNLIAWIIVIVWWVSEGLLHQLNNYSTISWRSQFRYYASQFV
jgi:hypothetical protein